MHDVSGVLHVPTILYVTSSPPIFYFFFGLVSAVYFEQKEYDECIKICEKAIDVGRENRADYKLIAK